MRPRWPRSNGCARSASGWCSTISARAIRSFGYLSRAHFAKIKIDQSSSAARPTGERESMRHRPCDPRAGARAGRRNHRRGRRDRARRPTAMRALGCDQLQGFLFGRPVRAGRSCDPATTARQPRLRTPFHARARAAISRAARPAHSAARLLGRRQVVRHRFLVPAFAGSNLPPQPVEGRPAPLLYKAVVMIITFKPDDPTDSSG